MGARVTDYFIAVMSTVTAGAAGLGVAYLRRIVRRVDAMHDHARDTDLRILDIYQRLGPEPRRHEVHL